MFADKGYADGVAEKVSQKEAMGGTIPPSMDQIRFQATDTKTSNLHEKWEKN
ncbi:MAG: hypothetical protein PHQ46_11545 [Negativicutes bacterium]|nr:hypothetical protein [Negativicutes bacterium]